MDIFSLSSIFKVIPGFLLLIVWFSAPAQGQPARGAYIDLQDKPAGISPTKFYIEKVEDERADKTSIGNLVRFNAIDPKQIEILPARIKGGSLALSAFFARSLPANKSLRPLVIKIKSLELAEKPVVANKAEGRIAISLEFGLTRDGDFIKLDSYDASGTYQRKIGDAQLAEPLVNNIIGKSLIYINNWMDNQAGKNIALAKSVRVIFTDHKEVTEGDTVYYSVNRPLKWTDFRAKPRSSTYAAEIFASMGYDEDVKLDDGVITVKLNVKVYVPKSACWVRNEGFNSYSLAHEQLHFDIVKLVAERFKLRLVKEKLNTYNYDGPINMAYLDALREINVLQKQYDEETSHGIISYQQLKWQQRVEKELKQLGIKPIQAQAAGIN